jgi:hypothetical protein
VALSVTRVRLSLRRDSKHLAAGLHALPFVHAMCPESAAAVALRRIAARDLLRRLKEARP